MNNVELLKTQTYETWDFENTWTIEECSTFAYLKDLPKPVSVQENQYEYDRTISGEGTEANPYIITTPEQLDNIRKDLTVYYKLGANIDLSGYENWEPIGDNEDAFIGELDGDIYTIRDKEE